jgi:hypothetical protein
MNKTILLTMAILSLAACNEEPPAAVVIDTSSQDINAAVEPIVTDDQSQEASERDGAGEEARGGNDSAGTEEDSTPPSPDTFEEVPMATGMVGGATVRVIQDNLTGCQWIQVESGPLIERPDEAGRQICMGRAKNYTAEDQSSQ